MHLVVINNSAPIQLPGADIIDTGSNLGYSGGANVALRDWLMGDEPYCVIGTHDLHVERDTFRALVAAMDANPDVGICGPVMSDTSRGADRGDGDHVWLNGQCLMFRRACVEALGGFDERFGSYCEDVDMGMRAWSLGWRVRLVDEARAHGLGSISSRAKTLQYGNQVALARKHRGNTAGLRMLIAQPLFAIAHLKDAVVKRDKAAYHLQRARARVASMPYGLRQFRRFGGAPRVELR